MEQTKLGESTGHPKRSGVDEFREKYRGKRDNLDELRHIVGFPVGEDEDIHRLSDPPYYTAYPNPHIKEFIERFGKPYDSRTDTYYREPYVGDVREGKNDPLYNAHTFHTKVPPKAVMRFIEHYTSPGDLVLDPFCGTGMTGIAASQLGRASIVCDLSPIATFIARGYNFPSSGESIVEAKRIHTKAKRDFSWMYVTKNPQGRLGQISFTVWSDVFTCPYCETEVNYYKIAFDEEFRKVKDSFSCPECGSELRKRELKHALTSRGENRQIPVLISYKAGKRLVKEPDADDFQLLESLQKYEIPSWYPSYKMMFRDPPWGDIYRAGYHRGLTKCHQFYTKRNLFVFSALWNATDDKFVRWLLTAILHYVSKKQSYTGGGGGMPGVLYIPSLIQEKNVFEVFARKVRRVEQIIGSFPQRHSCIITTQSASDLRQIPDNTIDYVFTDPPFGSNIMYSEGSFLWESWLKVFTNTKPEAIINRTQGKQLANYRLLMLKAFQEAYRVLKPNRWITVEFHNSRASVWNAIQESLAKAGFVIAQVAILDKKQGSFKQVTAAGAVKNDLVINAYKPKESFARTFLEKAGYGLERIFIEQHLEKLPIDQNIERTEQMLYSKMLAYYIQHGFEININAKQFYSMLRGHFEERDGYWFLDNQVDIYEERNKKAPLTLVQATLFISDERSAIQWLNWFLLEPKRYDEIYPEFVQVLITTPDKVPELRELLGQNFVSIDGEYRRPRALEKEEIEDRRNKRLLREFEGYLEKALSGRKLDSVRKEAVLAGFILCYREKRFQDILTIAKRIPKQIIESSTEIYDLIDVAETKIGDTR